MPKDSKPRKEKGPKKYTRAQAERALSHGEDPTRFTGHANYHVRRKAWMKMGQPLPENPEERAKFLTSIKVKEKPQEENKTTTENSNG